ncbi:MAG: hypothetical protein H0W42_07945 [Gemmatimonadaceae bacterium]|nr:hypothetical protein [Gemmatimonadaceae bacterium]
MSVTHRIRPHDRPRLALALAATSLAACVSGPGGTTRMESAGPMVTARATASAMVAAWPAKQRETVALMTAKYGEPTVMGDRMLAWYGNGPFVMTAIARDEVVHNFPMAHVDYLTQTVKHRVPADKLDDLNEYDGSVYFHRTRGELSAQCDVEEMNFLALNLAHDVIMSKRTPADARAFYAKTAMAFKQGDKSSPYTRGLIFQSESNAADPDRPHPM